MAVQQLGEAVDATNLLYISALQSAEPILCTQLPHLTGVYAAAT